MNSKAPSQQRGDRRKDKRFIKRLPGKIVVNSIRCLGITSDISENGMFLKSSRGLLPKTLLDIELTLADNKVSYLKGVVKRIAQMSVSSSKIGMGIELLKKDAAFRTLVHSLNGRHTAVPGTEIAKEQNTPCHEP